MLTSFITAGSIIAVLVLIVIAFVTLAQKKEGCFKIAFIEFLLALLSAIIGLYVQNTFDYISQNFFSENNTAVSNANIVNDGVKNHFHENFITEKENNIDPTCIDKGTYELVVYCECGEELSRSVYTHEALGHDYKKAITSPTCNNQGFTTFTCSRCNDTYIDDYVDALGHDYKEGICVRCGYSDPDYVKVYDSEEIMNILSNSVVSNTGGYSQYLGADSISVLAEDKYYCFSIDTAVSYNLWNHNIREIVFNISNLSEINILNFEIGGQTGSRGSVKIEFFVDNQFDVIPDYTYELDTTFTPISASINIKDATLLGIRVTNYASNENRVVFFNFSEGTN